MPRDALHLHHVPYWRQQDSRCLADPNPFIIRKECAAKTGGGEGSPAGLARKARPGKRKRGGI